jgi:tetratricopeptide (TPR) repeat protein
MIVSGEDLHKLHGFKPLLYPLFLAGLYKTTGDAGLPLAIVIQHGFGIGTGLIVALLATALFRNRLAGLLAGVIYLIAPLPLMFEGELLVESLYTFLICLGLLVHVKAAEAQGGRSFRLWLSGGALIVLAAQARPNILVFVAVYPFFALWCWLSRRRRAADTAHSVVSVNRFHLNNPALAPLLGIIGALSMAAIWGLVNLKQSPRFHLLTSAGGVNLYLGNKRGSTGMTAEQERRVSYSDRYQDAIEVWAREDYEAAMRAQGQQPNDDPIAVSHYWTSRALGEIRADPTAWVGLLLKKTWLMVWNTEIPNNKSFAFFQEELVWLRLLPLRWVLLFILTPIGVWAAAKRGNRDALFILLGLVLLYSAGNIAFFISDRYRYPIWPVMAVIAGGGLLALGGQIQARDARALSWTALSMLGMAAVCLPNWAGVHLPSFARDYLFRSIAWYEKGRFPEALQDVERSLQLDPADPSALQQRGNLFFALDRPVESKASFEKALQLSPGEAVTWNNLGVVYERLGETNAAIHAFSSATGCNPPSRNAFINLASLQIRASRLPSAGETITSLEKFTSSSDPAALALRAAAARRNGDTQAAEKLEAEARGRDKETAAYVLQKAGY